MFVAARHRRLAAKLSISAKPTRSFVHWHKQSRSSIHWHYNNCPTIYRSWGRRPNVETTNGRGFESHTEH